MDFAARLKKYFGEVRRRVKQQVVPTPAPMPDKIDFKVTALENRLEFENVQSGETIVVLWKNVTRIFAYKDDNFTFDTILVGIESGGPGSLLISEDVEGFTDFMEAMNRQFGISPEWYMNVMQPAFVTNLTLLYEAPDRT